MDFVIRLLGSFHFHLEFLQDWVRFQQWKLNLDFVVLNMLHNKQKQFATPRKDRNFTHHFLFISLKM